MAWNSLMVVMTQESLLLTTPRYSLLNSRVTVKSKEMATVDCPPGSVRVCGSCYLPSSDAFRSTSTFSWVTPKPRFTALCCLCNSVWTWELDHKESWALKNWGFWTAVLQKTLECPLDCKEIKPVNPKGNWSYTSLKGLMLKLKF